MAFKIGHKINLGRKRKPFSKATREKMSLAHREDKSYAWKGDNASYASKHIWVSKYLGRPSQCEFCKKNSFKSHQIHWANISGLYKRIRSDWIRLCVSCHWAMDRETRKINRQKNKYEQI